MTLHKLNTARGRAAALGHTLGSWETGGLIGLPRATCACGAAVLVNGQVIYGSAVTDACRTPGRDAEPTGTGMVGEGL